MKTDSNKINEILRILRVYSDMSLKEMSKSTGISASYISDIEHGRKKPSYDTIKKYADYFRVKPSNLYFFAEDAIENNYEYHEILLNILNHMLKRNLD